MKRLFVFDLDGTLYDLDDVVASNYEIQLSFVMSKTGKTRQEVVSYFEANSVFPVMTTESKSATELFLRDGFSREEWNAFRENRYSVDSIDVNKAVSPKLIEAFRSLGVCVLLSSNSYSTILRILNRIGMRATDFSSITCSDRFEGDRTFNKHDAMMRLLSMYGVEPVHMLSIGDRFNTDIRPSLEIGGTGVLVKKPKYLATVLRDLSRNSLRDCDEYSYFNSDGGHL